MSSVNICSKPFSILSVILDNRSSHSLLLNTFWYRAFHMLAEFKRFMSTDLALVDQWKLFINSNTTWTLRPVVVILTGLRLFFIVACMVVCFGSVSADNTPLSYLLLSSAYIESKPFLLLTSSTSRLGVHKKLGRDALGTADPKGYPLPFDIILSNKSWRKKGGSSEFWHLLSQVTIIHDEALLSWCLHFSLYSQLNYSNCSVTQWSFPSQDGRLEKEDPQVETKSDLMKQLN